MNKTSLSLLASVQHAQDSASWNRFLEVYKPLIQGWVRSYSVSSNDVDDLTQEVLAVVFQELPDFDHNQRTGAFRNWLRTILVYRLQNYWRDRKKTPAAAGGSSIFEQLAQLEDANSQSSRIWNEQHDQQVVARIMEVVRPRFQPRTWEAFRRQMFESQKPAEIAADLEMGVGSVYVARNRVLTALRQEAEGLVDTW